MIISIIDCWMKLLIHSQNSAAQPLKFRNGWISSSHTSLGIWLLMDKVAIWFDQVGPGGHDWIIFNVKMSSKGNWYSKSYEIWTWLSCDLCYCDSCGLFVHMSGLLHWHWSKFHWCNILTLPVPVTLSWMILVKSSCTKTKQDIKDMNCISWNVINP